jgi:phospholipid/cholesterol/gamma-HCH transport system permease protein
MSPAPEISKEATLHAEKVPSGGLALTIEGRLDADSTAAFWKQSLQFLATTPGPLVVNAEGVSYCDGAGIAFLFDLRRRRLKEGAQIRGLTVEFQRLLDQFDPTDFTFQPPAPSRSLGLAEETGRATVEFVRDLRDLVVFVGEMTLALCLAVRHTRRVRWKDVLMVAEAAGVNGLPIILLIGFLIGLIMSFQAAIPLRQFGADILVADLIALSMLRELGPLMTAIILAGRTGSAFAAELGTMKINEEVDALKTMGLDPVRFLVVSRVVAAVAVTPLLTLFANLMGLVGGAVVLMSLGYPLIAYVREAQHAVGYHDFFGGMVKSFVYGVLVAAIGCLRGLQTSLGASSVGRSTTRAVVSGIVLIALADGVFAVVYYFLDI